MAAYKNTYGLPDPTLQLIGPAPELNFGAAPNGGMTSVINALRGERSSNNPGVTLLANKANGKGITFNRKPTASSNIIPILRMPKAIAPDVTLPTADSGTPYVKPDRPVVPDLIYPVIDKDPVDPDPDLPDPEVEDPDVPEVPDPDPYDSTPDVIEDVPDPDPYDPTPDIIEDLPEPDPYDPSPDIIEDLPDPDPYDPSPDIIEDLPDPDPYDDSPVDTSGLMPELTDGSYWDSSTSPEPVGPTRGQPELPEEFDAYLAGEILNLLGGSGGGKSMFDETAANMAF